MKVSKKNYPYLFDLSTLDSEGIKEVFKEDLEAIKNISIAVMSTKKGLPPLYYACKTVEKYLEETGAVIEKVLEAEVYDDQGVILARPDSSIFYRIDVHENRNGFLVGVVAMRKSMLVATELVLVQFQEDGTLGYKSSLDGKMWTDGEEGLKAILSTVLSFSIWKKTAKVEFHKIGGKGNPKKGKGTRTDRVYNESETPVNQVDKSWYTSYEGTVYVRRHKRLQAYGEGWKLRKLIWVEPFSYDKAIKAKKFNFFNEKNQAK